MKRTGARYLAEIQVAMMLLTRLPAGQLGRNGDVPTLADAVWAYPLVGALVGGIGAAVLGAGAGLGLPDYVSAGLALAACAAVTGGLHEDGLADLADGFGGGRSAAQKLEIMRDSRIGSYGALALVFAVLLRMAALGALSAQDIGAAMAALIAIEAASRAGLGVMLRVLPPARSAGLGQSAAGVGGVRIAGALNIAALALAAGLGFGAAAVVAGCIGLGQAAVSLLAMRQIGGQTGDVLGAAQQVGALSGMIALLALI